MHLHTAYTRDSNAVGGRLGLPAAACAGLASDAAAAAGLAAFFLAVAAGLCAGLAAAALPRARRTPSCPAATCFISTLLPLCLVCCYASMLLCYAAK